MKKIVFIIPYFGKFSNYFQLFLNSCEKNPEFEWLIVTDIKSNHEFPNNVKKINMQFEELKTLISQKMNFEVKINRPHKLCDFKPAYGYIFEEYISNFEYWGHCDCDLIFGNLKKFINEETLEECEKFGVLGHLTLYKNTKEINRLFMTKLTNIDYEEVFTNNDSYVFDEEYDNSINNIFINKNKKIIFFNEFANIYTKSSKFRITDLNEENLKYEIEKKSKNLFLWDNGNLYRYIFETKHTIKKEFAYIHLQGRKMKMQNKNNKIYTIIPNRFKDLKKENYTEETLSKEKLSTLNLHYFRYRYKNLKIKIKKYKLKFRKKEM